MIRTLFRLTLFTFMAIPCLAQGAEQKGFMTRELFNPTGADKVILIAFADQHINRIHIGSPTSSYRKRGEYKGSTWSERIAADILEDYSLQYLTGWPMTEVGVHCIVYRVPESMSVDKLLHQMRQDARIDIAQRMHSFQIKAHEYKDPYFSLQSNLQSLRITEVHSRTTGRNIKIALIDTGVDINHPDLKGQVTMKKNFASLVSSGFSDDVHGTAVAGIIAARPNNGTGIVGIAPDSTLFALKACWPTNADSMAAVCNSFTLALAINSAIRSQADIINMSLTGPADPLLTMLLNAAVNKGIIVVAADAGEDNAETGFPASLENVIAVRTINAEISQNLAQKKSVEAPGTDVLTTFPHGAYGFVSGSSLATAHVSGIVALLRQLEPDISAKAVFQLLRDETSSNICKFICEYMAVSERSKK